MVVSRFSLPEGWNMGKKERKKKVTHNWLQAVQNEDMKLAGFY
jgi:uncharacterized protein YbdZ (MbtH family)